MRIKINYEADRLTMVGILAKNGYPSWIEEEKNSKNETEYFVCTEKKKPKLVDGVSPYISIGDEVRIPEEKYNFIVVGSEDGMWGCIREALWGGIEFKYYTSEVMTKTGRNFRDLIDKLYELQESNRTWR